MAADLDELVRRIELLERRVQTLEAPPAPLQSLFVHRQSPRPPQEQEPAPPAAALTPQFGTAAFEMGAPVPTLSREAPRTESNAFNLERFIGGRFYAFVGAIVVVIGVGLFLRLAVQRGWLSFPPAARCVAAAGFGAALLGAGEIARRKFGAIASIGLSAAGIATVYASVLAAYGWYRLLGPIPSLLLLAGVSGLGVVVALRANQLVLALLASIGAHLTPLVLWKSEMPIGALPAYLLAVLGFGLWLAAVRPNPFAWIRLAVMLGTGIVGAMWVELAARSHTPLVIGFLAIVWSAVHADLSLAVIRTMVAGPADERGTAVSSPSSLFIRSVLASLGATFWCLVVGVAAVRASLVFEPRFDWCVPAVLGLAAAALGSLLGRGPGTLVHRPSSDRERLSLLLLVQAGGLLATAMALGIDGSLQSACWLGLGTAAAIGGALIASPAITGYGFLLLAIAAGRLILWDSWHLPVGSIDLCGIGVTRWSWLMLAAGACLGVAGEAVRRRLAGDRWMFIANAAAGVALLLVMGAAMTSRSRGDSVAVWCVLVTVGAWGLASLRRSGGLAWLAAFLCVPGIALIASAQFELSRPALSVDLAGLILTRWSIAELVLAFSLAYGAVVASRALVGPARLAAAGLTFAGAAAAVVAPDLARCEGGAVVVWMMSLAMAMLVARGLRLPVPSLADAARAVLLLAVLAWSGAYPVAGWYESDAPMLLHPGLWLAALLSLLIVSVALWLRATEIRPDPMAAALAACAWCIFSVLVFAATSFEVARCAFLLMPGDPTAQNGAVSIWWGLFAGGLLGIGFARSVPAARRIGLGLLGAATAKAVFFDLRDISAEWRIASFLGLGLLMLAVAVVYARASRKTEPNSTEPTPSPFPDAAT